MRVITGISVLALMLAGCSDASGPATLEIPDPSSLPAAPARSASDAPAPSPSAAEQSPEAAAVAALEAYFASANDFASGGSADAHQRHYTDSCAACVSAASDFAVALESGLRADTERYAAWRITLEEIEPGSALLTSEIDFAAVSLVDDKGFVVEEVPGWSGATFAWTLARQPDGAWMVVQGQLLS